MGNCIANIAVVASDIFISSTLTGQKDLFSAPYIAQQLAQIFEDCCHRIESVQKVAFTCADRIVANVPPALCQRISLFTLLDLLSIMWTACLEGETDEYRWTSTHVAANGTTSVQLSDDFSFRRSTLKILHRKARDWVGSAINIAPLDIKGLLQVCPMSVILLCHHTYDSRHISRTMPMMILLATCLWVDLSRSRWEPWFQRQTTSLV